MTDRLPDMPLRGLTQTDGRRREVQTYRRLRRQLIADSGGPENVSAARLAVIDVLAQASAIAREEFAAYVTNPGHDPGRFTSLGNLVIGSAGKLGMERAAKLVPNLRDYLQQQAAEATETAQAQRSTAATADDAGCAP